MLKPENLYAASKTEVIRDKMIHRRKTIEVSQLQIEVKDYQKNLKEF